MSMQLSTTRQVSTPGSQTPISLADIDLRFLDTYSTYKLRANGLVINAKHHSMLCLECSCVVDHEALPHHFAQYHPTFKADPSLHDHVNRCKFQLKYPPNHPTSIVPVVYGLPSPKAEYKVCIACHKGYRGGTSRSFANHSCHAARPGFIECHVQTFGIGSPSPYFAVQPPPSATANHAWARYQEKMASRNDTVRVASNPDNYRQVHQLLRNQGWIDHVEGLELSQLPLLIDVKKDDPEFPSLALRCEAYLRRVQSSLKSNSA